MHSVLLFWLYCPPLGYSTLYYEYNKLIISARELSIYKVDNSKLYLSCFKELYILTGMETFAKEPEL